ncbi:CidA/LrgA family protein [Dolosigranulum savutiense]|uniref:CidA/LrgA family protein n=1 Tax=Dolosigranulum savutiense TaxID=3110288 RepID=A0AB74TYJ5_9LACT
MRIIVQLFWLFMFSFLGEVTSKFITFISIPGSVLGMIFFFLALQFELIQLEQVEEAGEWLTDNMAILFVPAGVGLMTHFNILGDIWWQLLIIIFVSTILMLGFVGIIVQFMMRRTPGSAEDVEVEGDELL